MLAEKVYQSYQAKHLKHYVYPQYYKNKHPPMNQLLTESFQPIIPLLYYITVLYYIKIMNVIFILNIKVSVCVNVIDGYMVTMIYDLRIWLFFSIIFKIWRYLGSDWSEGKLVAIGWGTIDFDLCFLPPGCLVFCNYSHR